MEGCLGRAALPLCAILAQEQLCHLFHQKVFGLYISHMTRKVGGVGVDPSPPVVIAGLCFPSIPQAPTVTTATLCRRCIGTSHGRKIDSCFTTTCFFDLFGGIHKGQSERNVYPNFTKYHLNVSQYKSNTIPLLIQYYSTTIHYHFNAVSTSANTWFGIVTKGFGKRGSQHVGDVVSMTNKLTTAGTERIRRDYSSL